MAEFSNRPLGRVMTLRAVFAEKALVFVFCVVAGRAIEHRFVAREVRVWQRGERLVGLVQLLRRSGGVVATKIR